MDFLTGIGVGGYTLFGHIIPFLIVLTIVVFFHELGHYLVARWNKVDIEAFSVGFGPELVGFNDANGTRWKISAIPLGGYVKFAGDANVASLPDHEALEQIPEDQREGVFEFKPVGQRAAVVVAGPLANFILAIVIFAGTFFFLGRPIIEPVVTSVMAESAAEQAGVKAGDIIRKIDGQTIESFTDIPRLSGPKHGLEVLVTLERGGRILELPVVPKLTERTDRFGNKHQTGVMGIVSDSNSAIRSIREYGLLEALGEGINETTYIITRTFQFLWGIIKGRESADQLSGPIGIAKISGQVATAGPVALITFTAILSVSIGLLNLFPVPMLDGGHLVFYAYEATFGRPMSERAQEIGYRIGLALLLCLMLFATRNDILYRLPGFG